MVPLEAQNDNELFFLAKLFVLVVFYQRCISYDCEQHQTCIEDVAKYMYVQSVIFFFCRTIKWKQISVVTLLSSIRIFRSYDSYQFIFILVVLVFNSHYYCCHFYH